MRKALMLVGNGLSIDFLKRFAPETAVDTRNLFKRGGEVAAPDGDNIGFLSKRTCPALWTLGVRPHLDPEEGLRIIEKVVSCAHAFVQHGHKGKFVQADGALREDLVYLRAYCELAHYLRQLFLLYDKETQDLFSSQNASDSWAWIRFINKLLDRDYQVSVVSYNYDLFLERALFSKGISVEYPGIQEDKSVGGRVRIFKPHGSINFVGTSEQTQIAGDGGPPRQIDYRLADDLTAARKLRVENDRPNDYWLRYGVIPPAGDSGRLKQAWHGAIRDAILEEVKGMQGEDIFVIAGLSYWHVDRLEVDSVISSLDPEVRAFMINPKPSAELDGVMSTLFHQYMCFLDANPLANMKI